MHLPGAEARGEITAGQRPGVGKRLMRRQVQPPSACPCLSPRPSCQHHPPKPETTHLRAKGKLTADAAEKFRGLSRGLLPAEEEVGELSQWGWRQDTPSPPHLPLRSPVGMDSGDRGRERVGEGVPTTRLLRFPLRQLLRGEVGTRSGPGLLLQRTTFSTGSTRVMASGQDMKLGATTLSLLPRRTAPLQCHSPGPASPASVFTIPRPGLPWRSSG